MTGRADRPGPYRVPSRLARMAVTMKVKLRDGSWRRDFFTLEDAAAVLQMTEAETMDFAAAGLIERVSVGPADYLDAWSVTRWVDVGSLSTTEFVDECVAELEAVALRHPLGRESGWRDLLPGVPDEAWPACWDETAGQVTVLNGSDEPDHPALVKAMQRLLFVGVIPVVTGAPGDDEQPHLMTEAEFEFLWANQPRDVE